ncbi:helix-turn-helix transcriptional regulator [Paracoccus sp. (in: a-proteobacteria)]|uniref:helix-turn-helix domain-containing protein n=1 Tax=Paracoccus sp. TaxID=267 RepID=UPI00289CB357|nr:helix-turn-helix transcriptional regulator [Paracoccus sp. (in: a-proteobacteria)]
MNTDQKERLAHKGKMGMAACAIRLKAARMAVGLSQKQLADALGLKRTTNISNMELAQSFPNREIMAYFFSEHRIDFNFLMSGHYAQLPGDVQDALFPALVVANNEWEQREGSDRTQASWQHTQSQT